MSTPIRCYLDLVDSLFEERTQRVAVGKNGERAVGKTRGEEVFRARKANLTDYELKQETVPAPPAAVGKPASGKRWIVSCVKTGQWWPAASEADAVALARRKGLVDYEVYPEDEPDA